jgi:hypothetical protein
MDRPLLRGTRTVEPPSRRCARRHRARSRPLALRNARSPADVGAIAVAAEPRRGGWSDPVRRTRRAGQSTAKVSLLGVPAVMPSRSTTARVLAHSLALILACAREAELEGYVAETRRVTLDVPQRVTLEPACQRPSPRGPARRRFTGHAPTGTRDIDRKRQCSTSWSASTGGASSPRSRSTGACRSSSSRSSKHICGAGVRSTGSFASAVRDAATSSWSRSRARGGRYVPRVPLGG